MAAPLLDAAGIQVFTDWLLERGFEPMHTDTFPWPMRHKGKISSVNVYWFNVPARGGLALEVGVEWESSKTRFRVPYAQQRQAVPITWESATSAVLRALMLSERIDASEIAPDPNVPAGMHMPPGLSSDGEEAWRTLVNFFKRRGLTYTGGSTTFYSPQEWRDRGEHYALDAVLIVTYDGGEPREAMHLGDDYRFNEQMQQVLHTAGFYFEEATGWYGGVYRT